MTVWAIVPVKPLDRGKSRLAGFLTNEERLDLNRRLLSHTLETLGMMPSIEQVLVISRDPAALALARSFNARTVQEDGTSHLNDALIRATFVAQKYASSGVLVLPADLPLITTEDVQTMLEKAINPPVVVIAPDRRKSGTNALLISPAGLIEYRFGPHSFQRHCELTRRVGARLEICELHSLAHDIDFPEDLELIDF